MISVRIIILNRAVNHLYNQTNEHPLMFMNLVISD